MNISQDGLNLINIEKMEDFKTRLITEKEELNDKINKLENFINSDNFNTIKEVQQQLLKIQIEAMKAYLRILQLRLDKLD